MSIASTDTISASIQELQEKLDQARQARGILVEGGRKSAKKASTMIGRVASYRGDGREVPDPAVEDKATPFHFSMKTLDELTVDHLEPDQQVKYLDIIERARRFMKEAKEAPGRSFFMSGNTGTGKTTIAWNILSAFRSGYGYNIDGVYHPVGEELLGRSFQAAELPELMRQRPLYDLIPVNRGGNGKRMRCIVIDDFGYETFGSGTYIPTTEQIYNLSARIYLPLVDYCYKNKISIIVTTNIPLRMPNGMVNEEIVRRFGDAAWDRIYAMAKGYFCHTPFRSYRQVSVDSLNL